MIKSCACLCSTEMCRKTLYGYLYNDFWVINPLLPHSSSQAGKPIPRAFDVVTIIKLGSFGNIILNKRQKIDWRVHEGIVFTVSSKFLAGRQAN